MISRTSVPSSAATFWSNAGIAFAPGAPPVAALPRSSAKIDAACVSPANSTPSGLNARGPIALNVGLVPLAALVRSAAGTPDQDITTVRINADFRNRDRIRELLFQLHPGRIVSPTTEEGMRRLLVVGMLLTVPGLSMAQQPATPSTQPQAPKMASDEVMALLEKGEVFFLDVREPSELEELGTLEGYVNIPLGQIEKRLKEIPKDKAIITA